MKSSAIPTRIQIPFANGAGSSYVRTVPVASQVGITDGAASYTDGFPPLNFLPVSAGGVPPDGRDMNGILNAMSAWNRWQAAAGMTPYDGTFCTAIGGYPLGAVLLSSDRAGLWLSTADDNVNVPDSSGTGWVPLTFQGSTAITLTGANVTLAPLQYARPILILSGTLTANVQLIFPAFVYEWIVYNGCTASGYTITAKTASGVGASLAAGAQQIWCDGTNIVPVSTLLPANLAYLTVPQTWTKPQSCAVVTLTDAASIAWDLSLGQTFTVTLSTSRALAAPSNIKAGTVYHLRVVVGTAGAVLSYASAYKGVSGITLATTVGAVNRLTFVGSDDGTSLELAGYRAGVGA